MWPKLSYCFINVHGSRGWSACSSGTLCMVLSDWSCIRGRLSADDQLLHATFPLWTSAPHLSPHELRFHIKVPKFCFSVFLFEPTWTGSHTACIHSVWSHPKDTFRPAHLHSLSVNHVEIILHRHNKKSIHSDQCAEIRGNLLSLMSTPKLHNVLCV